jgi:hypothetical protein
MTKANTAYHSSYEKTKQKHLRSLASQDRKVDKKMWRVRKVVSRFSSLHLHITATAGVLRRLLAHVLEQETPLEVLVGVHNGLELRRGHDALVLGLLELVSVEMFEYAAD